MITSECGGHPKRSVTLGKSEVKLKQHQNKAIMWHWPNYKRNVRCNFPCWVAMQSRGNYKKCTTSVSLRAGDKEYQWLLARHQKLRQWEWW